MLEIKDLVASKEGTRILQGVTLTVEPGSIHALMGPNGAGKSTLAKVLSGDPSYDVLEGDILWNGESIIELEPEERAQRGMFLGFQYPIEIPGISNFQLLLASYNAKRRYAQLEPITEEEFLPLLQEKMNTCRMKQEFMYRNVNEGFSGGEKKRNEIVQMTVLDPALAILDETDSGLDIDAMKIVADGVNQFFTPQKSLLLITHYQRLLDYIPPHWVHVLMDGKIVYSGGKDVVARLEKSGYDWLTSQVSV